MFTFEELLEKINTEIQKRTQELRKKEPLRLYEPVDYTLEMGGKRLRPVLVLLSYNLFSEDVSKAIPAALGIEVFHNFTLLHDDIMDKADVRRNRPTVHKKFSENGAILSGDAMAFLAYEYLLEIESARITDVARLFSKTALEVCEGQQLDMDFETRLDVTEEEYLEMIRLKTAVLLACSLKTGALLADAPEEMAKKLYDFGINLGLAFQLQDDMLDTFGNQETFGKKIGGDILANKKTFLLIKAIEMANSEQSERLHYWINKEDFIPEQKVKEVIAIYNQIGVQQQIRKKIDSFYLHSLEILDELKVSEDLKNPLKSLSNKMLQRVF
ncbi:polyprenyl synthetase family protein [Maribellus comscasis]|uniref:Polyprenyl synthetase family protein n=1 Tax=Maribellus comscasis TaxID=2681766 RepID=A0A6I6JPZ9_9BACT|nr:polyprenyl synthetase family protein [Maribellus comscasis]QGY44531.1 polyprenyl synthetase family protein [Maribellus comscasis]